MNDSRHTQRASEESEGGARSFAWHARRAFTFGNVYALHAFDGGVIVNAKKGFYRWRDEEEPERLRDSVRAFCVGDHEVFFVSEDGSAGVI